MCDLKIPFNEKSKKKRKKKETKRIKLCHESVVSYDMNVCLFFPEILELFLAEFENFMRCEVLVSRIASGIKKTATVWSPAIYSLLHFCLFSEILSCVLT